MRQAATEGAAACAGKRGEGHGLLEEDGPERDQRHTHGSSEALRFIPRSALTHTACTDAACLCPGVRSCRCCTAALQVRAARAAVQLVAAGDVAGHGEWRGLFQK